MIAASVKSYLSAVGAAAIYVSVLDQNPKSVGVARDLDRALQHLRHLMDVPVTFGWIAWAQHYEALVTIAKMPGLLFRARDDGVKVPRTLSEIVLTIETVAENSAIVLTPHKVAVERAASLARSVEQVFVELRTSGQLAAFNTAYKSYRRSAEANGEKVLPYWKATERLRRVTIQALTASPSRSISQNKLGELIAQEFPWFRVDSLDSLRDRA